MNILRLQLWNLRYTMGDPKKEKARAKAKPTENGSNVEELLKQVIVKLDNYSKKVDNNSTTCNENFKACEFKRGENEEKLTKLNSKFEELRKEFSQIKKENAEMKSTIASLTEKVKEYDDKFEFQARERKRANLSIEGVIEVENLPLEKLMSYLFDDLNLTYKVMDVCNKICRKGRFIGPTAGKMPRPRPIIVELYDASVKHEIFKNLKNMTGKEKWRNIYINDDLLTDQTSKMKNIRAINSFARSVGMETKIKGTKLIIDDRKYTLYELDQVPEEISI